MLAMPTTGEVNDEASTMSAIPVGTLVTIGGFCESTIIMMMVAAKNNCTKSPTGSVKNNSNIQSVYDTHYK